MNNIDTIMYLIDWRRSEKEQQKGIDMAREVKCIKTFFQPTGPGYCKSVWENCAYIICSRSDEELEPYVLDMLIWLQDLNWPGAMKITNRLISFTKAKTLAFMIQELIPVLIYIDEVPWLMSIANLLENQNLQVELDPSTYKKLLEYRAC